MSTISRQWNVIGQDGVESLKYSEQPIPELGDTQVLVEIRAASLNYRDILISEGKYPWEIRPNVVPGSDGAGIVLKVGRYTTRFKPGDKVVTIINQQYLGGSMTQLALQTGLGGSIDGTFRSIGSFDEQGLVLMPEGLSFTEAATLSCAGLTAWNALFGLQGKQLMAGQWLLTLGTGGVSVFAIQLAKAIGARVVATTSSDEKSQLLRRLGADHIINYRETPEWGVVAKKLTGGAGIDLVVEVGGPTTLKQSAASLKLDGTMSIVGSVGGEGHDVPDLLGCWLNLFTARGLWVGNRLHMEDLCRAIEANIEKLRPVVDPRIFTLAEIKEAYQYLQSGKHQGKVCIDMSSG